MAGNDIVVRIDRSKLDHLMRVGGAAATRSALGKLAYSAEAEAKRLMQEPKTGEVYSVPGTQTEYTASAPGEAPAVVTGTLKNSIEAEPVGDGSKTWAVKAGTEYAAFLEFGTPEMEARPFLRPAMEKIRKEVGKVFKEELGKEV